MSLFCKHHWKTVDTNIIPVYGEGYCEGYSKLPIYRKHVIRQACDKCGKFVVRKYRV